MQTSALASFSSGPLLLLKLSKERSKEIIKMIHGAEITTEVATEAPEAVSTFSDGKAIDDEDNRFKFRTTHACPRSFVTLLALAKHN